MKNIGILTNKQIAQTVYNVFLKSPNYLAAQSGMADGLLFMHELTVMNLILRDLGYMSKGGKLVKFKPCAHRVAGR
jgi:hypothetical protein